STTQPEPGRHRHPKREPCHQGNHNRPTDPAGHYQRGVVMGRDPWAAGLGGPVAITVPRRVKPGHEGAYEQFLAGISGAARAFPGYLGVEVFRPPPGGTDEY